MSIVTFGMQAMTGQAVSFEVHEQAEPVPGWIVIARWQDGYEEQLIGVFTQEHFAHSWIAYYSETWLKDRKLRLK